MASMGLLRVQAVARPSSVIAKANRPGVFNRRAGWLRRNKRGVSAVGAAEVNFVFWGKDT
jgi:hypothetical protein